MSPQVDRVPPYRQIFEHYRDRILRGELGDGDPLPTIRNLSEQWKVSRATAGRVIQLLQAEGLAESRVGAGTIVTTGARHESPREQAVNGRRAGKVYPKGHHARIVSAKIVQASEQVAAALRVDVGSPLIARTRVHYGPHKVALSVSTSYFPGAFGEAAPLLLVAERMPEGTLAYLERQLGRSAESGLDQYAARAAGPIEAGQLKIEPGTPVLAVRNWWLDSAGDVLEYGESVSLAERWRSHEYRLTTPASQ